MKKILYAASALVALAAVAMVIRQNLPEKRYARHMVRARMYAGQGNYTAAHLEYVDALRARGGFTPYATWEVLQFENGLLLRDGKAREAMDNTRAYLLGHPADIPARLALARIAFQAGAADTALEALGEVLDREPGQLQARLLLAQARTRQGRLDLAEEQLRLALEAHPDSLPALLPLAETVLREGRPGEARDLLDRILARAPRDPSARLLRVDSWLLEHQVDSAHAALDRWRDLDSAQAIPVAVRKARLYSLQGDGERAAAALAPYLRREKECLPAWTELALVHAAAGRFDSALAIYRTLPDLDPAARDGAQWMEFLLRLRAADPAKALETLKDMEVRRQGKDLLPYEVATYLALDQGRKADELEAAQPDSLRQALERFRSALEPDREFIGGWAMVEYWRINQKPWWGTRELEGLRRRWPRNRFAASQYAARLAAMGRPAEAAAVLGAVARPAPADRASRIGLLLRAGQAEAALALARQAEAEGPLPAGVNQAFGDFYARRGDQARAMAYWEKELAADPERTDALNNLAWVYGVERGDYARAKPYLERLAARRQADPRVLDTMGWLLARNGEAERAEKYFRLAVGLVPDYPPVLYHFGWLKLKQGKSAEGRALLTKALAGDLPADQRGEAQALLRGAG